VCYFFKAEDGIRDFHVTGVQTCALPISVEFNIELQDLLEAEIPEERLAMADLETSCRKLKKQLDDYGSINPMAKEAYDEMDERHGFIQKEKTDLMRSEEHTSELQSRENLVCRLLLEKTKD